MVTIKLELRCDECGLITEIEENVLAHDPPDLEDLFHCQEWPYIVHDKDVDDTRPHRENHFCSLECSEIWNEKNP